MTFKDQTAVITGGAQGIGGAVAEELAKAGVRVAVWDMDESLAIETAKRIGAGAIAVDADVADWSSVEQAIARTEAAFGRVDIMVNSAGIAGSNAPLADYPVEEFKQIVDVNLLGTFHVNRAVVPLMRKQGYGRIVNVASVAGKEGNPNASAYSASKAAVIGATRGLARELGRYNIRVNAVAPNVVDTDATAEVFGDKRDKIIDVTLSQQAIRKPLKTEDIVGAVLFLSSDQSKVTTGQTIMVDGGTVFL